MKCLSNNNCIYCFKIKIAEKKVLIECRNQTAFCICRDYIYDFDAPDFTIRVLDNEIDNEFEKLPCTEQAINGVITTRFDGDVESIIIYRKIANELLQHKTILIHGAAISLKNHAYIFMAPSGTGKTTHILNWKKLYPETIIINGDKPLINTETYIVYGTPWCGKEGYNTNTSASLSGIIAIERGEENHIESITFQEMLPVLLQQTYIPKKRELALRAYSLIGCFKEIPCYKLTCNMEEESAWVAYEGIKANEQRLAGL